MAACTDSNQLLSCLANQFAQHYELDSIDSEPVCKPFYRAVWSSNGVVLGKYDAVSCRVC